MKEIWPLYHEPYNHLGHCSFCTGRIVFVATSYAEHIVCQECREHLIRIEDDEFYQNLVKWEQYFENKERYTEILI